LTYYEKRKVRKQHDNGHDPGKKETGKRCLMAWSDSRTDNQDMKEKAVKRYDCLHQLAQHLMMMI